MDSPAQDWPPPQPAPAAQSMSTPPPMPAAAAYPPPPAGTPPAPTAQPAPAVAPAAAPPTATPPAATAPPPAAPAGPQVVETDANATDGLSKCPRCGATQIALNPESGNLRCGFCRFEFTAANALATYGLDGPPKDLVGMIVGSGSSDIIPSAAEVLTFKCSACGAEVVIDTKSSTQARCHWCRNTLSMNQQVPNGAVPDMILPFKLTKDVAVQHISDFVGKRMRYAHPRFKEEFNADNVMGVYLPYMVVDVNAHIRMDGVGEHETRRYTVGDKDHKETRYDADVYQVGREFDLYIDDLTIESSSERLDQNVMRNTNNVINSIMPFDVENSVVYDSNYLSGFTSEKRDTNIDALQPITTTQSQDIARYRISKTTEFYDRGVRWENEQIALTGQRWVSAYLPVWLYSYFDDKGGGKTHYVAVNARTGETMGSVPINYPKLLLVSGIIEIIGIILCILFFVVF